MIIPLLIVVRHGRLTVEDDVSAFVIQTHIPRVRHTNSTMKNIQAETEVMKNGAVVKEVAPLELVTLRSGPQ